MAEKKKKLQLQTTVTSVPGPEILTPSTEREREGKERI